MAEELKPCPNPWCVSMNAPMPIGLTNGYGNRSGWVVQCGCGVKTHRANTRHAAISGWNTRRPPPDRPDLADLDRSAVSAERPGRGEPVAWRWRHTAKTYGPDCETPGPWHEGKPPPYFPGEAWRYEEQPLFAHPAPVKADLLAWLTDQKRLELDYGFDSEFEDMFWRVHERTGNVNDQEWDLIGQGSTPFEALLSAKSFLESTAVPATPEGEDA